MDPNVTSRHDSRVTLDNSIGLSVFTIVDEVHILDSANSINHYLLNVAIKILRLNLLQIYPSGVKTSILGVSYFPRGFFLSTRK